jgi:methyl-accepting chemotaxis protein
VAQINQLLEQAAAGCESLAAVVLQTGEEVERARQAVEQGQERVSALHAEAETRTAAMTAALDAAGHRVAEHGDGLVALVDQLHGHREGAAHKLEALVGAAQERLPALEQQKAELLDSVTASAEQTKAAVAELAGQVTDFQAHAEHLHETARQAVETFRNGVTEMRDHVAKHRQQLDEHVANYRQALVEHSDALVQQVAKLRDGTEAPVAQLGETLDARTQESVATVGNVFAEQVVKQLSGGIESLLGAFGSLNDVTGGQMDGVESALDTIAGPVQDIGKVLDDIRPIVDLIRRML